VAQWRPADRDAARAALGISAETRVVVWHGRVNVHHKGLDVLLDAWQRLYTKRRFPRLLLLLVGSGQDAGILQHRIASLPPGAVRWEDRWVQPFLIRRYLAAADIATLSSRSEGFPVAVIEAMACGLPVVATNVSGVAEALGDEPAGVIVPREDAAGLAAALERLLADEPLRRELGARARQRAEKEFSLQSVGARLRAFIEEQGAFRPEHA
jgi:glycosyltransferase involved in cell wall biosynthesis